MYVSVFMSAMQREEMMARSRVRLSAITVEFVERRSGGQYLYCAIHRTFENIDNFSAGANGQQACRIERRLAGAANATNRAQPDRPALARGRSGT